VTCEVVPTHDGITGIANHSSTSTLFTLGRNHTIQQFDINPEGSPLLVKDVQHVPAIVPPSPPNSIEEPKTRADTPNTTDPTLPKALPITSDSEGGESENNTMSPLEKISQEIDRSEEARERRDRLTPLSPASSRTSSVSSRSSHGHRRPAYLYDNPPSSRASSCSQDNATEFSMGQALPKGRESMSIRSSTSYRSSRLRQEMLQSPENAEHAQPIDLFPVVKARLRDIPFQMPEYGSGPRTPKLLRREMLRVVFGWQDDAEPLIRDECRLSTCA